MERKSRKRWRKRERRRNIIVQRAWKSLAGATHARMYPEYLPCAGR